MEKFEFLTSIKEKLTEMNLPKETVESHIKIFEDCLEGKNNDEIEKLINSAGGIEGIINSIYNLESAKSNITPVENAVVTELSAEDTSDSSAEVSSEAAEEASVGTEDDDLKIFVSPSAEFMNSQAAESGSPLEFNADDDSNTPTVEIEVVDNIDRHIKEAEEITNTMEAIAISSGSDSPLDVEYGDELSDYDFEKLFEEKLSKPEQWAKKLRSKMSDKVFKATLPVFVLVFFVFYLFNIALFPVILISAIACAVAYLCTLIAGICFALVPIGYGVYMCFKSIPIALYELGIGITVLGITMFFSILLYNYVKRLTPFLFKQLKRLFKYNTKLAKRYLTKPVKEEI